MNPERSGGSSGQLPNRVCWWRDLVPRELEVSAGATAELEGLGAVGAVGAVGSA